MLRRRQFITGATAAASAAYIGLQPERVRAQSPCGTFYPVPPSAASAVGFTNLLFADDFNLPGTIGPSTANSGYNWYLTGNGATLSNMVVTPTATAASISNGNTTGGGYAPSPLGGILAMNAVTTSGSASLVNAPPSAYHVSIPSTGVYKYGCWEIYMQCNPNGSDNGNWQDIWFNSQLLTTVGSNQYFSEVDLVEMFLNNFGYNGAGSGMYSSGHDWIVGGSSPSSSGGGELGTIVNGAYKATINDQNFHKFTFLWVGGTSTYCTFLYDDVPQITYYTQSSVKIPTGVAGSGFQWLESSPIHMQLSSGGGTGNTLYIDYVRIWGPP